MLAGLGEQPDDEAGVEPARQQAAHRDVGDESPLDGRTQRAEDRVLPVRLRPVGPFRGALELRLPVGRGGSAAVGLDAHDGARLEFADALEDRPRCRHHRVEAQVMAQGDRIELGIHSAGGYQGGQRRREPQAARPIPVVHVAPVQRLDAESVPSQDDATRGGLGDREGEHALEVVDHPLTPLAIALEDDLGVAVGEEPVAEADQLPTKLGIVVDAPVEGHRQAEFGVVHGLVPGAGQVDDRQPAMTERDASAGPGASAVGPAGHHAVRHCANGRQTGRATSGDLAGDATHGDRLLGGVSVGVKWV